MASTYSTDMPRPRQHHKIAITASAGLVAHSHLASTASLQMWKTSTKGFTIVWERLPDFDLLLTTWKRAFNSTWAIYLMHTNATANAPFKLHLSADVVWNSKRLTFSRQQTSMKLSWKSSCFLSPVSPAPVLLEVLLPQLLKVNIFATS